ncbi:MAG: ROK family protein [Planctomycetes bacterium]|nr:ROK family protein [Planctomycetota bacterium]
MIDDHFIGFDLGGTKMLVKVYDSDYKVLSRLKVKTPTGISFKEGLAGMVDLVHLALKEAGLDKNSLAGLGIGVPGPVDPSTGTALILSNMGWKNVPMETGLAEALHCPVKVVNDVDAGIYGEYRFGAAREADCALGIFPGTGIGGGLIHRDEIFSSRTRTCMEIGHLRVREGGELCGCGNFGCLETVSSRLAIAKNAAVAALRGQAPYLLKAVGSRLDKIKSAVLAASIAAGDHSVELIVRDAARHLGKAVGNMVNLLSPDVVVFGGGIVKAMPKLFMEEVTTGCEETAVVSYRNTFRLVPAALGDEATAAGAAAWARKIQEKSS